MNVTDSQTQPSPEANSPRIPGLEDDSEGSAIVFEELRLLATVTTALASDDARPDRETFDDSRLLELRDDIAVAKPEDLPALFEQMHTLGALRAHRGKGTVGSIDRVTPYFAHIRLEEEVPIAGTRKTKPRRRDVLIGSRSYVDSRIGIRIVDWRQAPVSRIFYRYGEGDDFEESLGDKLVTGVVTARRSVGIQNGELVRVAAPSGTFVRNEAGSWHRVDGYRTRLRAGNVDKKSKPALGGGGTGRHDKHLPAIAAMLDPAQFDLITRPASGLVAVQGSAGSGKTTVGLHRIAYLAFADPQRFRPETMLVVVPNEALIHYIGRVLPALGVSGVPVTTFGSWARKLLPFLFPKMSIQTNDDTPPIVARAKSHSAMLGAIDKTVAAVAQSVDHRIRTAMAGWPEGRASIVGWDAASSATSIDQRVSAWSQWAAGKRSLPGADSAQLGEVTRGAVERIAREVRAKTQSVASIWDELLTSRALLDETLGTAHGFGRGQLDQVHDWCMKQARIRHEGERDGELPTLDAEDRALLLRIWQVLRGQLADATGKPLKLSHLFVDEVQDASPVELRVLVDLVGTSENITLAGDIAQRMLDDEAPSEEFDWNSLLSHLSKQKTTIEPLKVSYRSTAEITRFAREVLGPLAHEAEPIAPRSGPPVELFSFGSPGEAVAWLADALKDLLQTDRDANIALVARFGPQADLYYEGLTRAEVPNVRRVASHDFRWEPGIDITDVRQTKGLEFDEVILLDTNAATYPASPQARHSMYVAATRAAHQLWCVASDTPSPLVTAAIASAEAR